MQGAATRGMTLGACFCLWPWHPVKYSFGALTTFLLRTESLLRHPEPRAPRRNRYQVVYAVVRAGGRQEKVEVGTIVVLDRQSAKIGDKIELPAVLLVDGDAVTTDADKLAKVAVTAEVLGEERGPKIVIQKFKNKTGYKKRQGHRQDLTRVKITGIK
jgi:large subunit ribosomal protein L21